MATKSVGFVGGGRVATILLWGLAKAGKLPASVVVSDTNQEVLAKLKASHPSIETACCDNAAAAAQDIVFVAVHPPLVPEVVPGLRGALQPTAIVVSLAPKFTFAKLTELLGGFDRLARLIPNAPSIVGSGYNPVAFGAGLTDLDRANLLDLLAAVGEAPQVAEEKLEAYALTTAMGPSYLWYQLYELHAVAQACGLSKDEACAGILQMVHGVAATMGGAGLSAQEVMDLIPVKPLADLEPVVAEAYRTKLPALFEKIRP